MKAKLKPKNPEARSLSREARREQILKAAREVFAERGYHGASVSAIVARCGVAQGTFYLYFQSKREVFEALLDAFAETIYRTFFLPGAERVITQEEVWSRFVIISSWALEVFSANQDLARLFLLEAPAREPGFEEKVSRLHQRLVQATAANFELWMERGLLRPADPKVLALCVIGMIEHLLRQKLSDKLDGDFWAVVEEAVKFELFGILQNPEKIFGRESPARP
jgi:AcrR family transcriptional regulator